MSYVNYGDLGGQPGHGAVTPEPEGVVFHAPWEGRALALTLAMGATGAWNLDQSRSARETLPGYAGFSYYKKWVGGLTALLVERGLAGPDELAAGRALHPAQPVPRRLAARQVAETLARGTPFDRAGGAPARFEAGQDVRTRGGEAPHHSRLPRYAQGKRGTIERVHGRHVLPDTNSRGLGEQPQWLYTVVFDGRQLWPDAAPGRLTVSLDAWEPYLEAA